MNPKTESKMELTPAMQKRAVDCIHEFAKGQDSVKKATDSVSAHVLNLFQFALKQAGKEKAEELFGTLTRYAERVYSEENSPDPKKPEPVSKLLPFWRVAKSQVLNAFRGNVDMAKVKSVYDAQKEVKAKKRSGAGAGGQTSGNKEVTLTGPIAAALEKLYATIKTIALSGSADDRTKAADILTKADSALTELVNKANAHEPNADVEAA